MFLWAALEKGVPFVLNFAITIIMARLVPPEAYGLVAMTAAVMAIGGVIQNVGLSSALIQRAEPSEDDATTVFIANVVLSVAVGCGLVCVAPTIAAFYERPELRSIVWANAFMLFVASLGIVQTVILQRHYKFRIGFIVELGAIAFAGSVAITMALAGYDAWALVAFSLGQQGARTVLLWLLVRWVPRGRFRWASFAVLWSYGRHLLLASLYHNVATNLTSVLIGKFYSAGLLGLFTRAQSLQMMPVGLVTMPFQRVAFPLYSRHQHDMAGLTVLMRTHTRVLSLLAAYITAGLATCAEEIVLVLFGPHWVASGSMLQVLAAAAFPALLMPIHSEANKGIGRSHWFLWIEIAKKTVLIAALVLGMFFGIMGFLIAIVLVSVSDYILSAICSVRFIGYGWQAQLADLLPSLGTGLAAFAITIGVDAVLQPQEALVELLLKGMVVTLVFGAMFIAFGARAFPEASVAVRVFVYRTATRLSFS